MKNAYYTIKACICLFVRFAGYKIPNCRSEMCSVNNVSTGMCADAAKVCFDHSVGISLAPENPPPLFLCEECASRLQSEQPNASEHLYDILLPIMKAGTTCENKVSIFNLPQIRF